MQHPGRCVKASYQCTWQFPLSSPEAEAEYEALVAETRGCIGDGAVEHLDQPVNHPDIYRSSYYEVAEGQISVSLKNKSEFSSTLISIRIDAQP